MEDAEANPSSSTEPAGTEPSEKAFNLPEQLRRNLALLEQAVALKELRLISGRLQRQTAAVRRALTAPVLLDVVQDALPTGTPTRDQLLQHLQKVIHNTSSDCHSGAGAPITLCWSTKLLGAGQPAHHEDCWC